jgi:purine-nucleoside phosphorylase
MSPAAFTRDDYEAAARTIRERTRHQPTIGLILGSGLGGLADAVQGADVIPSAEIPSWPRSTVQGHAGRLVIGSLEGQTVLVQQGRSHYYEGYTMQEVTFPVRVMACLGIKTLIVTNAAGGLNKAYHTGDLMLISDHIFLPGMAGHNPLNGPNDSSIGERFPSMSDAYDAKLRDLARRVAAQANITLHEGVYAAIAGPSFETPAEIRMLRLWGADAVGMSTAPEAIVARHAGLRVLGISSIANETIDFPGGGVETTHEEVLASGQEVVPRLIALLRGVLKAYSHE